MTTDLASEATRKALSDWISNALGQPFLITDMRPLSGGAIQENWLIEGNGQALVLRTDAPATIAESRSREEEFTLLSVAWDHGVTVPEPLAFCHDASVIGRPFALMRRVSGDGFGPRIVKAAKHDPNFLADALGRQLARIHAVPLNDARLTHLLNEPERDAAREIAMIRAALDDLNTQRPVLEWILAWMANHAPAPCTATFLHRDFRTGNFMLEKNTPTAILDWEFAGHGDPMSDLGWFCAECWRFSRPDLEAGGIGPRAAFYAGYETEGGQTIDHERVLFWEVMAHARWAAIALQQGHRHLSGTERDLNLALTGEIPAQLEWMALSQIERLEERWGESKTGT